MVYIAYDREKREWGVLTIVRVAPGISLVGQGASEGSY